MDSSPVEDPIARLRATNALLTPKLHGAVLALGPYAVEPLIELLRSRDAACDDAPGEGRPPIHAVDLLVDLKAQDAIAPLLDVLIGAGAGALIRSRIVSRLPELGVAVLEPALRFLNQHESPEIEDALCAIVSQLGLRDERIFARLCEYFDREPGYGASCFAAYGDPRALALLSTAIERFELEYDPAEGLLVLNALVGGYEQLSGPLPRWLMQRVEAMRAQSTARDVGLLSPSK